MCEREYQRVNAKIRHKYTVLYFKIFLEIDKIFFSTIFLKDLVLFRSGLTKEEKVHLNLLVTVFFYS